MEDRYLDATLSSAERAADLVAKLSREEKFAQLQNFEINLQDAKSVNVWSDYGIGFLSAEWMQDCETIEEAAELQITLQKRAIELSPHHIPASFYVHGIAGAHLPNATTFPCDLNRGASFNTRLEKKVGEVVARQALSLGIDVIVAPVMDISKDFYVEKLKKTFGEARTLGVIMGAAYSAGVHKAEVEGRKAGLLTDQNSIDWDNLNDDLLDQYVYTVLESKFRHGIFEHPFALQGEVLQKNYYESDDYDITRTSAEDSLVLLKNDGVLPLHKNMKKVAVIGPHAKDPSCYYMNEKSVRKDTVSLFDTLCNKRSDSEFLYARGFEYEGADESGYEEALNIAREADAVIVTVGMRYEFWNHEIGGLDLVENCGIICSAQEKFIVKLAELGKPMIGVHFGVHPLASDTAAFTFNSVLEALLPGEATGDAIVDVIYGKVNPGGRLPLEVVDVVDRRLRLPFAYGKSFSKFAYSNLRVDKTRVHADETFQIRFLLRNEGGIAGPELLQLYLEEEENTRKLLGLRKVFFLSGESHEVIFEVSPAQVAIPTYQGNWKAAPGKYAFSIGRDVHDIVDTVVVELLEEEIVEGPERVFYSPSTVV